METMYADKEGREPWYIVSILTVTNGEVIRDFRISKGIEKREADAKLLLDRYGTIGVHLFIGEGFYNIQG